MKGHDRPREKVKPDERKQGNKPKGEAQNLRSGTKPRENCP